MDKRVDLYVLEKQKWIKELNLLREAILSVELKEEFKWSAPAYSHKGKNVVGLGAYKNYVAIWFFHGALLNDNHHKFVHYKGEKAKAMRQWRFEGLEQIINELPIVIAYVSESKSNMENGKLVKPNSKKPLIIPEELINEFNVNEPVRLAFEGLSHTKRREFSDYISGAKQMKTKLSRLDKVFEMIKNGVGLNDKYRKC